MPFIKGSELYKVFCKQKRFPEHVIKFIGTQLVLGLGALHAEGFMHRDMKLENIMVDENGYIKIIDFGMAKVIGQETSFDMYGTREYLAPEMVTKSGHDFSVDWWAVGILLYEMLIGITPFYQRTQA